MSFSLMACPKEVVEDGPVAGVNVEGFDPSNTPVGGAPSSPSSSSSAAASAVAVGLGILEREDRFDEDDSSNHDKRSDGPVLFQSSSYLAFCRSWKLLFLLKEKWSFFI